MVKENQMTDSILIGLFSAIPIIFLGVATAFTVVRGPWSNPTVLTILMFTGFYGWFIIVGSLSRQYPLKANFNNWPTYIGCGVGIIVGLILSNRGILDPNAILFTLCLGFFWGAALSTIRTAVGRLGLLFSIAFAFISWIAISLLFHINDCISCTMQHGLIGVLIIGHVGGIIGPAVYQIRHAGGTDSADLSVRSFTPPQNSTTVKTFVSRPYLYKIISASFVLMAIFFTVIPKIGGNKYLVVIASMAVAILFWKMPNQKIVIDDSGIKDLRYGGTRKGLISRIYRPDMEIEWSQVCSVSTSRLNVGSFLTTISVADENNSTMKNSITILSSLFEDYAAILRLVKARASQAHFDKTTESILIDNKDVHSIRPMLLWFFILIVMLALLYAHAIKR